MAQGQRNRLRDQSKRRSRTSTGIDASAGAGEWMAGDDRQGRPAEGLVGAHDGRRERLLDRPDSAWVEQDRDDARFTSGAEVGPTAKAARDQRKRHLAEGSSGRMAARIPGKKGKSRPSVAPAAGKRASKPAKPAARSAAAGKQPAGSNTARKATAKRRGRAPAGPTGISRSAGAASKKRGR